MERLNLAERVLKARTDNVSGPQIQVEIEGIIYTLYGQFRGMPDVSLEVIQLLGPNATEADSSQRNPEAEAQLLDAIRKLIAEGSEFNTTQRLLWDKYVLMWSLDSKGTIMKIPYFQVIDFQPFDHGAVVRQNIEGKYYLKPGTRLEWEAGSQFHGIAEVVEVEGYFGDSTFFTMKKIC